MTTATVAKTVNGVNVEDLFKTVDAVRATPGIAKFKFRLGNEWLGGGHNRSTINTFYGVHQENVRRAPFSLDADEPPVLLGQDAGPNPVDLARPALVAPCIAVAAPATIANTPHTSFIIIGVFSPGSDAGC